MALVIEDGSIVAGATSFVTRAEIIEYAAARGITLADDKTTDVLAIRVMDFLQTLCFRGTPVDGAELPFPRTGLYAGDDADDWEDFIPPEIVRASLQLSLDVHGGVDLTPSNAASPLLKRSKVGPLEREFFPPGADQGTSPPLTVAMAFLSQFLCADEGMRLSVIRA